MSNRYLIKKDRVIDPSGEEIALITSKSEEADLLRKWIELAITDTDEMRRWMFVIGHFNRQEKSNKKKHGQRQSNPLH